MFFNNKCNTFFGLNLTLVYTFPMCMTWRFHFPLRNYDFNMPQSESAMTRLLCLRVFCQPGGIHVEISSPNLCTSITPNIDIFDHTHWKHILHVFVLFLVLSPFSLPPWGSDSAQGLQHPYAISASEHPSGNQM